MHPYRLRAVAVIALLLLVLPLSALAQDETPTPMLDLSTEEGLLAFQEAQGQATAADVGLPDGFGLELVANGLSFPSAVAVAADGTVYAALSGWAGATPEIVQLGPDGTTATVAAEGLVPPITGLSFGPDGTLYVTYPGEVATVDPATGTVTPILTGLPGLGNHQNNHLAFGPDGWVYFGIGSQSNSMVVGLDDILAGWVQQHPEVSDVPCRDITLAAEPFETTNPLTEDPNDKAMTSPYHPFGTAVDPGTVVPGQTRCTGSVLRFQPADPEGTLEVFAWGFRNPYSVAVDPTGAVWVIENGADVRGSRPIAEAPDNIWRLEEGDAGTWFGYPDYVSGIPVTDPRFAAPGVQPLGFLIANHDELLDGRDAPPTPVATWAPHDATAIGAVAPESWGEMAGNVFVTHHGDFAPVTGPLEQPFPGKVDRVEQETGAIEDFLVNPNPGPAGGEPERPAGLAFAPDGSLYIADLGVIEGSTAGLIPRPNTGAIWRVVPSGVAAETPVAVETLAAETPAAETPQVVETPPVAETPAAETPVPVTTPAVTGEATPEAAALGEAVAVSLTEFAIDMPTTLPAGPTTFVVTNDGSAEHNFEVEGQGIEEEFEQNLQPGERGELQVDLQPGAYEVYCPVGNHRGQGMEIELTVAE